MISEYKNKGEEQKCLDEISIEFGLIEDSKITGSATVPTTPPKTQLNTPLTTTPSATTPEESSSSIKADRYKSAREEAKILHDQVQRERLEARIAKKTPYKKNRIISDDRE
jgi:heme-binding NEAT domain protein